MFRRGARREWIPWWCCDTSDEAAAVTRFRLRLNEGTVYNSLLRLAQEGWISSEWGASESNRKAKFYSITKTGRKQLARETESWERISSVIGRVLRLGSQY
jgi:DNA-binding PadR family transcriptional regulator